MSDLAQRDVYAHWSKLTDPTSFDPQPPKSFRGASAFVQKHGGKLSTEVQKQTLARLRTVSSGKIEGAMRELLKGDEPTDKKVSRIIQPLDDSGIQVIKRREPLPAVAEHEVRIVAWMAARGSSCSLD